MNSKKAITYKKERRFFPGRIFFHNLFMLTALVIVPMLLAVAIGSYSQRIVVEKEVSLYSLRTISLLQNSMNQLFSSCLKQADYLLAENNINLFLITEKDGYTFYHNNVIYKLMHAQMQANTELLSIYIYSDKNNKFVSNYGETSLERFFDKGWMEAYDAYEGDDTFFYSFRNGTTNYLQPVRILSLYKILMHGNIRQGVIVYNINFDRFAESICDYRGEYDTNLSLRTKDGTLVQNLWGDPSQFPADIRLSEEGGVWENRESIVHYSPVEYTDLYFHSVLSRDALQASLQKPMYLMILLIAGVFLFVLALTFLISMRIYQPFKKILSELETPAGLLQNRVRITRDEEGFILDSIYKMSLKNEQITEELAKRVALLKQAQSIALQSQINPHFLHNTLDSISWATMRLTGGKNEASVMLSKLAQILRYSLDDVDSLVSLRKELDNTRLYLELQELRYKNCFHVKWEIEEEILDCQVIKIMLQPIVENAIQHGLKPLTKDGILRISAKRQQGLLVIAICDNGTGIPAHRLASIQAALHADMIKQQESIGIINVHQRIQLFYGEDYGVKISSGEGTQVILSLPFVGM